MHSHSHSRGLIYLVDTPTPRSDRPQQASKSKSKSKSHPRTDKKGPVATPCLAWHYMQPASQPALCKRTHTTMYFHFQRYHTIYYIVFLNKRSRIDLFTDLINHYQLLLLLLEILISFILTCFYLTWFILFSLFDLVPYNFDIKFRNRYFYSTDLLEIMLEYR